MFDQTWFVLCIFFATVFVIIWRPFGVNESVPAAAGAVVLFVAGVVPLQDVYYIAATVSGAAVTILSTIIMSIVMESVGFFRWAAFNLAKKANGSGLALFWYTNLLCFLMTMFFNNDGSILIATPIIIQTLTILNLKSHQKIPYLLSGVLVATGSSAPIGVSNLANLIALNIVNLDLNQYIAMMFVPSMLGIGAMLIVLFLYFKRSIPRRIPLLTQASITQMTVYYSNRTMRERYHPLAVEKHEVQEIDWNMFRVCLTLVVLIRISFFALAPLHISTEWPALAGAVLLIAVRWYYKRIGPYDVLKRTPWHILVFAFGMYVVVYGLHNTGMTSFIVEAFKAPIAESHWAAVFIPGLLLTVMSNLCNNLPSVMIGTISITEMQLASPTLQVAYLANVIGSDIGALLLPIGTLASLLWMFILRENKIPFTFGQYVKAALVAVPVGLVVSLFGLYVWTKWLFF
jgi:arsenical pump membrane protein